MRRLKLRPVGNLLNDRANPSRKLIEHSLLLERLSGQVRTLLPNACRPHCRVANLRAGLLSIAVDSPAWAARVRFLAPRLLQNLQRQTDLPVHRIEVSVMPVEVSIARTGMPRPGLSHKTLALLEETAQSMDDPALRAALLRLARRRRST
jgi:hypothetical protein